MIIVLVPAVLLVHVASFLIAAFFVFTGKPIPGIANFVAHPVKKTFVFVPVLVAVFVVAAALVRAVAVVVISSRPLSLVSVLVLLAVLVVVVMLRRPLIVIVIIGPAVPGFVNLIAGTFKNISVIVVVRAQPVLLIIVIILAILR